MASRRRAAEDKNTKLLRELAALPANKQCFDCLQRGPTYINVTIGSFVCTTCSGILRGVTPPHRLKSISMTTFTPEEIEFLKNRGNEYCKYVWLGTFDTTSNSIESEVSDDLRKRDFMVQKYEKKRWYVDPDIAIKKLQSDNLQRQKQGLPQSQSFGAKPSPLPATQPLSKLLGKSPTPLVVQSTQPAETWPHPVSSASAPTISTKTAAHNQGAQSMRSFDIFAEFNENPVTSAQCSTSSSTANGNFANFDNAFSTPEKTAPIPNMPTSASLDAYPKPPAKNPANLFSPVGNLPPIPAASAAESHTDRYAALAQLDSLFNQPEKTKAPTWEVASSTNEVSVSVERTSGTYSTAPSNPFTSNELWSQPQAARPQQQQQQQQQQPAFPAANPFQTGLDNSLSYTQQPMGSQPFVPFSVPLVGNSPSEDNVRNQFNANFNAFPPSQMVSGSTNGYSGSQMGLLHNGSVVSPSSAAPAWNMPMWNSSQVSGPAGLFANDNKSGTDTAQHLDWIQNPVNPFMAPSNNVEYPVATRNNYSNPFL